MCPSAGMTCGIAELAPDMECLVADLIAVRLLYVYGFSHRQAYGFYVRRAWPTQFLGPSLKGKNALTAAADGPACKLGHGNESEPSSLSL